MDNQTLARLITETGDLLEISGADTFRVRSYRRAAEAAVSTGSMPLRDELLAKYPATILELLKLPSMGPKTIALLWESAQVGSIDQLAEAIDAGRLAGLPRMGEKQIEKLKRGIDEYRKSAGRFRIDEAEESA